ncbi:MAG: hypothetical protein HUU02_03940 [Bacteroidetes bacterium]|nr:hypothetical protein [Bacteroidota bacterium]
MVISDIQKIICNDILNSTFYSVDIMLTDLVKFETIDNPTHKRFEKYWALFKGKEHGLVPQDRVLVRQYVLEYIALVNLLVDAGLVVRTNPITSEYIYPIYIQDSDGKFFPDQLILSLIREIVDDEIYPLEPFKHFIKNNFVTIAESVEIEERHKRQHESDTIKEQYLEEKKARRISQRISIGLAIISLAVSLYSAYTYSITREVFIKNPSAFRDTTKVILLQTQNDLHFDTLKSKLR